MNDNRERIVAAFESIRKLLCDLGYFAQGNQQNGVYVRYWGNRKLRELSTYRDGIKDGFSVRTLGPAIAPLYSHFRRGVPFGEATGYYTSGRVLEHFLVDGESKTLFSNARAEDFAGYLTSADDENLFRRYAVYPSKTCFM